MPSPGGGAGFAWGGPSGEGSYFDGAMRSIVLPFVFCLTLWAVAFPQTCARVSLEAPHPLTPGRLITVRVEGAPSETRSAFFDLGPAVHGLQLFPAGEGRWEGSFAVLPSMVGQHFQARAHLYDANRQAIPVTDSDLSVQVASSTERQPGVIAETSDGRVAVAFDDTIRLSTVEVRTLDQKGSVTPVLRNNYVVLPPSLKPEDIVSVTARNIQGQPVKLLGPASLALGRQ